MNGTSAAVASRMSIWGPSARSSAVACMLPPSAAVGAAVRLADARALVARALHGALRDRAVLPLVDRRRAAEAVRRAGDGRGLLCAPRGRPRREPGGPRVRVVAGPLGVPLDLSPLAVLPARGLQVQGARGPGCHPGAEEVCFAGS